MQIGASAKDTAANFSLAAILASTTEIWLDGRLRLFHPTPTRIARQGAWLLLVRVSAGATTPSLFGCLKMAPHSETGFFSKPEVVQRPPTIQAATTLTKA